jgi:putative colanic acid biosynthesis UDP-glucose lipid carrier transferase
VRSQYARLRLAVRAADGLAIVIALWGAMAFYDQAWSQQYALAAALAVILFQAVGDSVGMNRPFRSTPMRRQVTTLLATWALVIPFLLAAAFFLKVSEDFSRVTALLWFAFAPVTLLLWRTSMRLFLQEMRARGRNTRTVAIVGATDAGERIAREVRENPWFGLRIVGFFDDRNEARTQTSGDAHEPAETLAGIRGNFDALLASAKRGDIDTIYVALPLRAEYRIRALLARLADTTASVHVVTDLLLSDLLQAGFSSVGDVPVLTVYETPFEGVNSWLKRAEDVLVGTAILALIAVPMVVIAAAIKLTSRGSVFFRQTRYGLNGQPIRVLKFRTMTVCEDGASVTQATLGDARITRLGGFLRRMSLDELPQFLNVLTGEMSIVGPRPHAVAHNELYRSQIPGYMLRHKVKPGITGWAQVNGWRGETDTLDKMSKRVDHDLAYIRGWNLWLDLRIILMTVFGRAAWRNAH